MITAISFLGHSHRPARATRFGKGASMLRGNRPLTDEEIREAAPSIFAVDKHESRSARYAYIPTSEVLRELRKEGFAPYMVQQSGSGDETKRGFTKHMLRLRHESQGPISVGDTFGEIILVNSHDGTSSYHMIPGLFRLICSNGMVVGAGSLGEEVKVKHTGQVIPQVIDGCVEVLSRLPHAAEQSREWSGLRLTEGERRAFAKAALELRYEQNEAPITDEKLLTLRRREDADPSLWNTLNTVQENVIRGGIGYVLRDANGRRKQMRRTAEVKAIDTNVKLNRALWTLAEEMRKLKA